MQKLLKLGADPLLFTVDYRYPADLAENSGFTNVSCYLKGILFQIVKRRSKFFSLFIA